MYEEQIPICLGCGMKMLRGTYVSNISALGDKQVWYCPKPGCDILTILGRIKEVNDELDCRCKKHL